MKENGTSFKEALRQTIRCYQDLDTKNLFKQWNAFSESKKDLFELLSRMSLSDKYAKNFFKQEKPYGRWEEWVDAEEFLENPYLVLIDFKDYKNQTSFKPNFIFDGW